jgi:hypothetical protein
MVKISTTRCTSGILITVSTQENFFVTQLLSEEAAMELHQKLTEQLFTEEGNKDG